MSKLKRHLNESKEHKMINKIINCKQCKAYFTDPNELSAHAEEGTCKQKPIPKGEKQAEQYFLLYAKLFPNSPLPASPFYKDRMSRTQLPDHELADESSSDSSNSAASTEAYTSPTQSSSPPDSLQDSSPSSSKASDLSLVRQESEVTHENPPISSSGPNRGDIRIKDDTQVSELNCGIANRLLSIQRAILLPPTPSDPHSIQWKQTLEEIYAGLGKLEDMLQRSDGTQGTAEPPNTNPPPDPTPDRSAGQQASRIGSNPLVTLTPDTTPGADRPGNLSIPAPNPEEMTWEHQLPPGTSGNNIVPPPDDLPPATSSNTSFDWQNSDYDTGFTFEPHMLMDIEPRLWGSSHVMSDYEIAMFPFMPHDTSHPID
ncbi:hypothetical protein SLS56_009810 [Neofusicoccum ribis]|uniref:C2H2-type domain-containing protein n=1 Tax=Neofusicoccum ribis TaxID=45134 RepID=A0ABR3SGA5_9PEZI